MTDTDTFHPTELRDRPPSPSVSAATAIAYLRETLEGLQTILGDPAGYAAEDRDEIREALAEIDHALARTAPFAPAPDDAAAGDAALAALDGPPGEWHASAAPATEQEASA